MADLLLVIYTAVAVVFGTSVWFGNRTAPDSPVRSQPYYLAFISVLFGVSWPVWLTLYVCAPQHFGGTTEGESR